MVGKTGGSFARIRIGWAAAAVALALSAIGADAWVYLAGSGRTGVPDGWVPDRILVPGASVLRNGRPSPVLRQRVETALFASRRWPACRLVLSGSVSGGYDEPASMRRYLLAHGVDSTRMVLDRVGLSTATSMDNLGAPRGRLLVASQPWHLPRACWLARIRGWDVRGLEAGEGAWGLENLFREHVVRIANFWEEMFRHPARLRGSIVSFHR